MRRRDPSSKINRACPSSTIRRIRFDRPRIGAGRQHPTSTEVSQRLVGGITRHQRARERSPCSTCSSVQPARFDARATNGVRRRSSTRGKHPPVAASSLPRFAPVRRASAPSHSLREAPPVCRATETRNPRRFWRWSTLTSMRVLEGAEYAGVKEGAGGDLQPSGTTTSNCRTSTPQPRALSEARRSRRRQRRSSKRGTHGLSG